MVKLKGRWQSRLTIVAPGDRLRRLIESVRRWQERRRRLRELTEIFG